MRIKAVRASARYAEAMISSLSLATSPTRAAYGKLLPREHGSWALAFEPVVLGLLAAFSVAGLWLSLAVAAAFLARRPWQLRAARAEARIALLVLALLGASGLLMAIQEGGVKIIAPLLTALPFGLLFLWYDTQRAVREAVPEIAGAAAFSCVPAALALCAGLPAASAWTLAVLVLVRAVPTVCVVRSYLRTRKERSASVGRALALGSSLISVALVALLVRAQLCPASGLFLAALLALRALWLLGPWAPDFSAKTVGIGECVLGVIYVGVLGATF
jgi:hypothetical protein